MFLQVRLVQGGLQVLTAHSMERALQLANIAPLDDALIDVRSGSTISDGAVGGISA
jgi:hypothetical protein